MDLIGHLRERSSFLTTKEVMELLQLRRNTLCQWVRAGRLPAIRSGNAYLYDPVRLADWLSERAIGMESINRKTAADALQKVSQERHQKGALTCSTNQPATKMT